MLLAPEFCDRFFSIITLMNSGHIWLFNKRLCTFSPVITKKNAVTLPHSAQRKHLFLVKTKENSTPQKQIPKKKCSLGLLYQRLLHRSTSSLLSGYTVIFNRYIELWVDPEPFFTSCQISTINTSLDQIHLWNTIHLSNGCSWTS